MTSELSPALRAVVSAMLEKKIADVVVLDVRGLCSFTDYHVIGHGTSRRQVQAAGSFVEEKLAEAGVRPYGLEGLKNTEWVLMDFLDFVVHIFLQERREFYDLESLWGDAQRIAIEASHG